MWQEFESKPIIRTAYQITDLTDAVIVNDNTMQLIIDGSLVAFKHHEPVKLLDWVVRLTEEDTYHCTDAVFRERNIVE